MKMIVARSEKVFPETFNPKIFEAKSSFYMKQQNIGVA